jgi:hypothetical protein
LRVYFLKLCPIIAGTTGIDVLMREIRTLKSKVNNLEKNQGSISTVFFAANYVNCGPIEYMFFNSSDTIIYNNVLSNQGNGLDAEAGVFNAPKSGTYSFSFTGTFTSNKLKTWNALRVRKNGQRDSRVFYNISPDSRSPFSAASTTSIKWFMALKIHDEIQMEITDGNIRTTCGVPASFSGVLMEEN